MSGKNRFFNSYDSDFFDLFLSLQFPESLSQAKNTLSHARKGLYSHSGEKASMFPERARLVFQSQKHRLLPSTIIRARNPILVTSMLHPFSIHYIYIPLV